MTVSSVTLLSPPDSFDSYVLRPAINVLWSDGVGPFNVRYEWDDNTGFTSPITVLNTSVTSPNSAVPTSDMGPIGTDWYLRVTVIDTDDSGEVQDPSTYYTMNFLDADLRSRYLYINHNIGVGFNADDSGDGNPDLFSRYLYLNHNLTTFYPIGVASENEISQEVDKLHIVHEMVLSVVPEVETAQIVIAWKPIFVVIGTTSEIESSQAVVPAKGKFVAVGLASETEVSQEVVDVHNRRFAIGIAYENEDAYQVIVVEAESFVIKPINNPSLSALMINRPSHVLFSTKSGIVFVRFRGKMYTGSISTIHEFYDLLLAIKTDNQIVNIDYPADSTVTGNYYITDVKVDVVKLASGHYEYDINCERVSVV